MSLTYSASDFKEFSRSTQQTLVRIGNIIGSVSLSLYKFNLLFAFVGVIINVLHLAILSRKSMNTNSINVLLIGIAISDLFSMSILVYQFVLFFSQPNVSDDCLPPASYYLQLIDFYLLSARESFHLISTWLAVIMASIRYLVMKYALKSNFQNLSKKATGQRFVIILFICSLLMSLYYSVRVKFVELPERWKPAENCKLPKNTSFPDYDIVDREWFLSADWIYEIFVILEGLLKIVPSILLPILACLLIKQIKLAGNVKRKVSSKTEESKLDHTSKLVFIMTIIFSLTEGPLGIVVVLDGLATNHTGLLYIINDIMGILLIFETLNSSTHFFICVGISSQYRKAIREMFGLKKKKPKTVGST
ncbi:hypothetical protein CRE_05056 [Caenorhabditis remanei]|uniref:G-protein coupled receptors family 1 profile domain-containing protein n=1 Tax=Caenorhabditis remanei TaxID=31234 RepID=E3MYZ5_CAERE|nr:hypothetical protein CRE_05056 [Caenorhabditis remanei]